MIHRAFFVFIASVLLFSAATANTDKIDLIRVNDISEFKDSHSGLNLIELVSYDHKYDGSRSYTLGSRQTGDAVVANANDKKSWPTSQNVTTTLAYPTRGPGAYLTFILINVEQSSNIGRAYITSGGVNQHYIQIVIEASVTNYFNYAAFFYGIK